MNTKRPDIEGYKRSAELTGDFALISKEEAENLCTYIQELERSLTDAVYFSSHYEECLYRLYTDAGRDNAPACDCWLGEAKALTAQIPKENK